MNQHLLSGVSLNDCLSKEPPVIVDLHTVTLAKAISSSISVLKDQVSLEIWKCGYEGGRLYITMAPVRETAAIFSVSYTERGVGMRPN